MDDIQNNPSLNTCRWLVEESGRWYKNRLEEDRLEERTRKTVIDRESNLWRTASSRGGSCSVLGYVESRLFVFRYFDHKRFLLFTLDNFPSGNILMETSFGLPFTLKRVKTAWKRLRTKTLLVALTMTSLLRKHVRFLHDRASDSVFIFK